MARTRVKVCGITRPEDAQVAGELGVDAIGLIFYRPSPRAVDATVAREIARAVAPFVTIVGVFVNAGSAEIRAVLDAVPIDLLQFHGDETPEQCAEPGKPFVKAVRMSEGTDLPAAADRYRHAKALLLDTYKRGIPGGTGQAFDWSMVSSGLALPIVLAGGLNPENVAAAVARVRPFAVDVNGGVQASTGGKDAEKIATFMREVRRGQTTQ